jgi:DNA phosphorothioation-dependent restriction protein DptG
MPHSAKVSAFLSVRGQRVHVAKMNRDYLTLVDACELAPKTEAQLNIIIDEKKSTRTILLTDGVAAGQREVRYSVLAPF